MSFFDALPVSEIVHQTGKLPTEVALVTADSRKVVPGSVFVAVSGNAVDGHGFIETAIKRGAAVIIHEKTMHAEPGAEWIQVHSSRRALALLCLEKQGNPQRKLKLVGTTGTNGKTTISSLIWQVLTRIGFTAGLLGTVRKVYGKSEVTSALTTAGPEELAVDLRRMVDEGCSHCIMEVSSHALDQDRVYGLDFEVAVFTNLTHDHLDYHKTMESYAGAKKKLFDGLSSDATAIINQDDPMGSLMSSRTAAQIWRVGFEVPGDASMLENSVNGLLLDIDGTLIQSPLVGKFNAYNVAQAYLAAVALGISPTSAAAALSEATGAPGRLQRVDVSGAGVSVFVDYAHTPDALKNILETMRTIQSSGAPLVVVFGCGGDRDAAKRPEMAAAAETFADRIVVTSDNPRFEDPAKIIDDIVAGFSAGAPIEIIQERPEAISHAIKTVPDGAVVIIAGKGHELYQDVKGVKHPMDDVKLAENALNERAKGK